MVIFFENRIGDGRRFLEKSKASVDLIDYMGFFKSQPAFSQRLSSFDSAQFDMHNIAV
jgi:hypothetical protein